MQNAVADVSPRDLLVTDDSGNQYIVPSHGDSWWYSTTGNIVKWAIFLALLFGFLAFLVIGRMLALRRLKQDKAPAKWNRWLLSRRQRAQHEPRFRMMWPENQVMVPATYNMHQFVPAPAYNAHGSPPVYQPPEGSSKVNPVQTSVKPFDNEQAGSTHPAQPAMPPAARMEP